MTNDELEELKARLAAKAEELAAILVELQELAAVTQLALDQVRAELGVEPTCSSCGAVGHSRCLQ